MSSSPNKLQSDVRESCGLVPSHVSRLESAPTFTSRDRHGDLQEISKKSTISNNCNIAIHQPRFYHNHAAKRQETQDPQDQRKGGRCDFLRPRSTPGISLGLSQAQSATSRTWPRTCAEEVEGGHSSGEKRGAHSKRDCNCGAGKADKTCDR
jgi:hypothetical protein